jgi:hypothetical protein
VIWAAVGAPMNERATAQRSWAAIIKVLHDAVGGRRSTRLAFGQTRQFGYNVVRDKVSVRDTSRRLSSTCFRPHRFSFRISA